jgi:hypothetical protein
MREEVLLADTAHVPDGWEDLPIEPTHLLLRRKHLPNHPAHLPEQKKDVPGHRGDVLT